MEKFDKSLMATAVIWSKESHCIRRKVGAVLSIDGRLLMSGHNGTLTGMDNCCEDTLFVCPKCTFSSKNTDFLEARTYNNIGMLSWTLQVACKQCRQSIGETNLDRSIISNLPQNIDPKLLVYPYLMDMGIAVLKTNEFTLHAEQNVITYCARKGIATEGATLHVTTSPCKTCSKLIASVGIKRVVYLDEYRDDGGIKYLKEAGVDIQKYKGDVIW